MGAGIRPGLHRGGPAARRAVASDEFEHIARMQCWYEDFLAGLARACSSATRTRSRRPCSTRRTWVAGARLRGRWRRGSTTSTSCAGSTCRWSTTAGASSRTAAARHHETYLEHARASGARRGSSSRGRRRRGWRRRGRRSTSARGAGLCCGLIATISARFVTHACGFGRYARSGWWARGAPAGVSARPGPEAAYCPTGCQTVLSSRKSAIAHGLCSSGAPADDALDVVRGERARARRRARRRR